MDNTIIFSQLWSQNYDGTLLDNSQLQSVGELLVTIADYVPSAKTPSLPLAEQ